MSGGFGMGRSMRGGSGGGAGAEFLPDGASGTTVRWNVPSGEGVYRLYMRIPPVYSF